MLNQVERKQFQSLKGSYVYERQKDKNNEQHKLLTIRSNSKQTSRFTHTSQTCNDYNIKAKNIGISN